MNLLLKLIIFVMIGLLLILNGCYNNDKIKCDFEAYKKSIGMGGFKGWSCKMVVSGVIYDKERGKCIVKQNNACKNPYPFSSIKECEEICLKPNCIKTEGTWSHFSSGCFDLCENIIKKPPIACTLIGGYSCDCGPDKCWNGSVCILNEEYCVDKKIDPNLQEKLKGWFVNEDGSVKVEILCTEGIDCTELVEKYKGTIYQQAAPWLLDVNLPNSSINKLASEPEVVFIGRGNMPIVPHSE